MKILLFTISFSLLIFTNLYSLEIIDCNQFKKFSIKYLECKTKNFKSKLNENQSETKEKLSESTKNLKSKIETSETKKKIDKILKKNDN